MCMEVVMKESRTAGIVLLFLKSEMLTVLFLTSCHSLGMTLYTAKMEVCISYLGYAPCKL